LCVLIDLISGVGLGDSESKSKDLLGRVYEYFLGQFADADSIIVFQMIYTKIQKWILYWQILLLMVQTGEREI
jgi:hypothetical protein